MGGVVLRDAVRLGELGAVERGIPKRTPSQPLDCVRLPRERVAVPGPVRPPIARQATACPTGGVDPRTVSAATCVPTGAAQAACSPDRWCGSPLRHAAPCAGTDAARARRRRSRVDVWRARHRRARRGGGRAPRGWRGRRTPVRASSSSPRRTSRRGSPALDSPDRRSAGRSDRTGPVGCSGGQGSTSRPAARAPVAVITVRGVPARKAGGSRSDARIVLSAVILYIKSVTWGDGNRRRLDP